MNKVMKTIVSGTALAVMGGMASWSAAEVKVERRVVEERVQSERGSYRVVQLVSGLEHPWSIAWLPDGRMLVTERPGRLNLIDGETVRQLGGLPKIDSDENQLPAPQGGNQGGLLDVAVHPDFENNGWIYFTYSSPGDPDSITKDFDRATGTALSRAKLNDAGTGLVELQPIYGQTPRTNPGRHYGSRIVFPDNQTVMFSIGDRGLRWTSQDLTDPAGSIIRLNAAGGAHAENPFIGAAPGNLRPEIFSFGHRNNQGLAIDRATGAIWATDHGPSGGDLLYRVEAGKNYGWPMVAHGREYSTGEMIGMGTEAPGVEKPVKVWPESRAPSGLMVYDGEAFPQWRGQIFAGFLLSQELVRLEVKDGKVAAEESLLKEKIGRVRDVRQGPDGLIYLLTDHGDGGVFRIEPAE